MIYELHTPDSFRSFTFGNIPAKPMRRRSTFLNVLDNGKERQYTEDEKRFLRKLHFVSTVSPTTEVPSRMKLWGISFRGPNKKLVIDPGGTV